MSSPRKPASGRPRLQSSKTEATLSAIPPKSNNFAKGMSSEKKKKDDTRSCRSGGGADDWSRGAVKDVQLRRRESYRQKAKQKLRQLDEARKRCANVAFYPQAGSSTCWFCAMVNAIFYSDGIRDILCAKAGRDILTLCSQDTDVNHETDNNVTPCVESVEDGAKDVEDDRDGDDAADEGEQNGNINNNDNSDASNAFHVVELPSSEKAVLWQAKPKNLAWQRPDDPMNNVILYLGFRALLQHYKFEGHGKWAFDVPSPDVFLRALHAFLPRVVKNPKNCKSYGYSASKTLPALLQLLGVDIDSDVRLYDAAGRRLETQGRTGLPAPPSVRPETPRVKELVEEVAADRHVDPSQMQFICAGGQNAPTNKNNDNKKKRPTKKFQLCSMLFSSDKHTKAGVLCKGSFYVVDPAAVWHANTGTTSRVWWSTSPTAVPLAASDWATRKFPVVNTLFLFVNTKAAHDASQVCDFGATSKKIVDSFVNNGVGADVSKMRISLTLPPTPKH